MISSSVLNRLYDKGRGMLRDVQAPINTIISTVSDRHVIDILEYLLCFVIV